MDDDFNTQGAIGVLFKLINKFNTGEIKENYSISFRKVNDMLNILGIKITFRELENIKEELIKIINDYSFYNSNDENLSELELVKKL